MRVAVSILAALTVCSALAQDATPLLSIVGDGSYSDPVQEEPRLLFRVTTRDPSSYVLAGTNLASWTDTKGGIVCSSPVTNARPWIVENDLDGYPGFGLGGGQYLDLATPIPASNVMIVAVGYRATQNTMWTIISHTNATGGPAFALWNDATVYLNPAAPNALGANFSGAGLSNRMVVAALHLGGNISTNTARFWFGSSMRLPLGTYSQSSVSTNYNRIGARKSDGYAVGRFNEISVFGGVTDTNAMLEIIGKVKEVWGI